MYNNIIIEMFPTSFDLLYRIAVIGTLSRINNNIHYIYYPVIFRLTDTSNKSIFVYLHDKVV